MLQFELKDYRNNHVNPVTKQPCRLSDIPLEDVATCAEVAHAAEHMLAIAAHAETIDEHPLFAIIPNSIRERAVLESAEECFNESLCVFWKELHREQNV